MPGSGDRLDILVVGYFAHALYEEDFVGALRRGGLRAEGFSVLPWFGPTHLFVRAQTKLMVGPAIPAANLALLAKVARTRPRAVLLWTTPWLSPRTIHAMKHLGVERVALYTNDDPFGPDRGLATWRRFRRLVPHADICFAYRTQNLDELRAAGARRVAMLRSGYDPRRHRPVELSAADRERFDCDVVFVGHCEDDARLEAMDALLASGLSVKIFGNGWEKFARGHRWESMLPIVPALGDDYAKAIAAAKVAVVFLSGRNRDQYTRRCFEIPAIGTLMLAPRSQELLSLYREDEEALFYDSPAELVSQAKRAVDDEGLRRRVAAAGRRRCVGDGHDLDTRAVQWWRDLW